MNQNLERDLEEGLRKTEKSVFGFFVKRFRITFLILALIIVNGFYALWTLPKESEPEVDIPFALVNTIYPGANPVDMEDLVTNKLEDKIQTLEYLKTYTSSSGVGVSLIFVEFEAEADMDKSLDELKEVVDEATPSLPSEAEDPFVQEVSFVDMPIVTYSFSGDYSDEELQHYADKLQDAFENTKDVSKAPISGGIEREFQLLVNQKKLKNYGIPIAQIMQTVRGTNFNMPAGDIEIDEFDYTVRVQGKFQGIRDLKNLILMYKGDTPIYLRDIAEIKDTFKEKNSYSRIGVGDNDPKNTISLQIFKKTGGNILRVVDNANKAIDKLYEDGIIPQDLEILKTNDNSVYVKDDVERLGRSGIQTMILIIAILFLVLGIRGSLIAGFSVPIAFLMSFIFIMQQGMTINSMVLFAMVLSLGLMVDNSIIVMEGINEYMYKYDKTPLQAALLSVWNYKWPIMAGTMTTVCAFLPMLLVSGIMGEYMGILPKTLSATLLASLFVALIIIPALSAKFYKKIGAEEKGAHRVHKIAGGIQKLQTRYINLLKKILPSKAKRRTCILAAIGLMIGAIMLPVSGLMKVELFPGVDVDFIVVNTELPIGSSLEKTSKVLSEAENMVREISEMENYVTTVGGGFSLYAGDGGGGSGGHLGHILVNLKEKKLRERKSYEIAESIRDDFEKIQGGEVRVQELQAGPPTGAEFEAKIFGEDLQTLSVVAKEVRKMAEGIDGLINISDTVDESSGELTFELDHKKIKLYGLDATQVAMNVRQVIFGTEITTINLEGDDVEVVLKYEGGSFDDVDDLENIILFTQSGQDIKVKDIADLKIVPSVLNISHLDGDTVVRIRAETEKDADLRKITKEFEENAAKIDLPEGYNIEVGGETEDLAKSFTEMLLSMIVAIFLIMSILVLQFDSYKKPLVVIFTVPLAIIGAFVGLTVLRLEFSLPAFIGIISLAGIVVNDAIVLMDRINKNIKRKMDLIEGVIEAGIARMQPVFLTSITTILGVLPLTFSEKMWAGLGVSIIFGLMFSTVLTLLFVPILFTTLFHKKD
jgi:multidrug efflux pump subunit AcrB